MKNTLNRRILKYGTTILVVGLSTLYLYLSVDIRSALGYLRTISLLPFGAAILCYYLTVPLRTGRWMVMLRGLNVTGDMQKANGMVFLSLFFNTILPAKSGDAYRCMLASKEFNSRFSTVLGTVVVERAIDILILSLGLLILSFELFQTLFVNRISLSNAALLLFAGMGILACIAALTRVLGIPERIKRHAKEFWRGVRSIDSTYRLGLVVIISLSIWSVNVVRMGFVAISIGANLTTIQIIIISLIVSLLTGLPYSPAGIGVVEAITTSTLLVFGLSPELGLAFVLVDRLITIGSVVITGTAYYLYRPHLSST